MMNRETYVDRFRRVAGSGATLEKAGSIEKKAFWDSVKSMIDSAAAHYAQLSEGTRMAINAGAGGLAGAGIGSLFGKKGKKLTPALIGALIGGGGGAAATKYLRSPEWFLRMAARGTRGLVNGDVNHDDDIGRNLLRYLSSNAPDDETRKGLSDAADQIGKPARVNILGRDVDLPPYHFDVRGLREANF